MFIVWEIASRREFIGKVADFCPSCDRIRAFFLTEMYRIDWLLGVQIHKSACLGTFVRCRKCQYEWPSARSNFSQILPIHEEIDLTDLIAETNPGLAKEGLTAKSPVRFVASDGITDLEAQARIQSVVLIPDSVSSSLIESIRDYAHRGPIYDRLRAKLDQWRILNSEQRDKLTAKVARFLEVRRTEEFLVDVTRSFPSRSWPGYAFGFLIFVFLLVPITALIVHFAAEIMGGGANKDIGSSLLVNFLGDAVLGMLFGPIYNWWKRRQWFKHVLIPRGEKTGIDFQFMKNLLEERGSFGDMETPALAGMRQSRITLYNLLRSQGEIH